MKPMIVKLLMVVSLLLIAAPTFAGQDAPNWLVDKMYGSGKINTVILVVSVVLVGIGAWMFTLDRRLGRLEKRK